MDIWLHIDNFLNVDAETVFAAYKTSAVNCKDPGWPVFFFFKDIFLALKSLSLQDKNMGKCVPPLLQTLTCL